MKTISYMQSTGSSRSEVRSSERKELAVLGALHQLLYMRHKLVAKTPNNAYVKYGGATWRYGQAARTLPKNSSHLD